MTDQRLALHFALRNPVGELKKIIKYQLLLINSSYDSFIVNFINDIIENTLKDAKF